jgi:Tfp pilus assembly protein PilZ
VSTGNQPKPVRLRVAYRQPERLLSEYTKSAGRGGVLIETKKSLPVGTKFVFEMHCEGMKEVVELEGAVVAITAKNAERHILHIRYDVLDARLGIDATLQMIFQGNRIDRKRNHARIPLVVRAVDERPNAIALRVRDISVGGIGFEVEGKLTPNYISVGEPTLFQIKMTDGLLSLHGHVNWKAEARGDSLNAQFGMQFGRLNDATLKRVERLVRLQGLPHPPWIAKVAFGSAAVAAMPI